MEASDLKLTRSDSLNIKLLPGGGDGAKAETRRPHTALLTHPHPESESPSSTTNDDVAPLSQKVLAARSRSSYPMRSSAPATPSGFFAGAACMHASNTAAAAAPAKPAHAAYLTWESDRRLPAGRG